MARSSYVYIVQDGGLLIAGFTVKHELATWLTHNAQVFDPEDTSIARLPDGGREQATYLGTPSQFLAAQRG